ncbi:MarR family winged helix-turn-helix transcriptional regulator [Frigidibacter oleivorans]|uniref:MarR family winged helix-turn-helix transcriptional regulator n=1 Tax=Frigidibacter oleivorans TaxID=2487129 RepID=UPI000F8E95F8|nr:MarR family transcriptional regulator [Frigidibacter oleivorans]
MTHIPTLDERLCFSLYAASLAINRLYKPLLDRLGITYPQYLVLHVLWEEDGRGIGAIAARLDLEPSTITPLVKRLEAAGLVSRARRVDDERGVLVTLTDRGRALQADTVCLAEALFAQADMSPKRLAALNHEIRHLHHALTQRKGEAPAGA